jgi:hypothetical protein
MIKKYNEHIAYLNDYYDPEEIMELVGIPSGLYFTIKRKDHTKVQQLVNWSEKLQTYTYRDKDYAKIMFLLDKQDTSNISNAIQIEEELRKLNIVKYRIINDKIKIFGDVVIQYATFTKMPIPIDLVQGDFKIINSSLETLENCPHKIEGEFNCSYNRLKSLKGGPKNVKGMYNCSHNHLVNLYGSPMEVWSFDCSYNRLRSLMYSPSCVNQNFNCSHNMLETITDAPIVVNDTFDCSFNELYSLKGMPKDAKRIISISNNLQYE